jgi:hypothetical protein
MNIKNYTSQVDSKRSRERIESMLVNIGASHINKSYKDKICTGITFLIYDNKLMQTIPFNLSAKVEVCYSLMLKEYKDPTSSRIDRAKLMEQAERTAWKLLCDWTEVQCSLITLGQAEPLQMFLPFVYDIKSEQTYYDKISSREIKLIEA